MIFCLSFDSVCWRGFPLNFSDVSNFSLLENQFVFFSSNFYILFNSLLMSWVILLISFSCLFLYSLSSFSCSFVITLHSHWIHLAIYFILIDLTELILHVLFHLIDGSCHQSFELRSWDFISFTINQIFSSVIIDLSKRFVYLSFHFSSASILRFAHLLSISCLGV